MLVSLFRFDCTKSIYNIETTDSTHNKIKYFTDEKEILL